MNTTQQTEKACEQRAGDYKMMCDRMEQFLMDYKIERGGRNKKRVMDYGWKDEEMVL